jgi:hypothetical protein
MTRIAAAPRFSFGTAAESGNLASAPAIHPLPIWQKRDGQIH